MKRMVKSNKRASFELFKSAVCHLVRDKGDIDFIIETLEGNEIRQLYEKKWYPEALYLLAMVDYLSRENDIPLCADYNDIRSHRLKETLYPTSTVLTAWAMKSDRYKAEAKKQAIPEFMKFNIVESGIRDVY